MMRAAAVSALALLFAPAGASRSAVSEAIKVDQVGYLPTRPKLAMVTDARATGAFRVRRVRDGAEVAGGALGPAQSDPDTGDTVRVADFSTLTETGAFYLDVPGVGTSDEFDVAPDVYCLLYTSPSPRDLSTSRMPSSA